MIKQQVLHRAYFRSSQNLEIPEINHVFVAVSNHNTPASFDWIAWIERRHQGVIQIHLYFSSRGGVRYCQLDVEPCFSLGGTFGA